MFVNDVFEKPHACNYVELYSRSSKFIIQNGIIGERTEKILRLVFA